MWGLLNISTLQVHTVLYQQYGEICTSTNKNKFALGHAIFPQGSYLSILINVFPKKMIKYKDLMTKQRDI
jgi:hypothetical protein